MAALQEILELSNKCLEVAEEIQASKLAAAQNTKEVDGVREAADGLARQNQRLEDRMKRKFVRSFVRSFAV